MDRPSNAAQAHFSHLFVQRAAMPPFLLPVSRTPMPFCCLKTCKWIKIVCSGIKEYLCWKVGIHSWVILMSHMRLHDIITTKELRGGDLGTVEHFIVPRSQIQLLLTQNLRLLGSVYFLLLKSSHKDFFFLAQDLTVYTLVLRATL